MGLRQKLNKKIEQGRSASQISWSDLYEKI
jgi:hypothetical protein